MTTIAFDTYALVKELKGVGFSEEQAVVQVETITKAIDVALEHARHEHELDDLVTNKALDVRIRELELKVAKDIAESKAELIRWVVGVGLLQTALIAALLIKLSHTL